MKHTRNTCTVQNAHTMKQQNNPENQMRAIGEGLLHFSMLPLMGKFPALPLRQTQWRSFSLWVPTPSLTAPDNFMVQPVSSPGGRAMLPSPSAGTKLGLPLHCALGETFSSNWSTAYLWDSLQLPGRAKQPEHTWEGRILKNAAYGVASDYDQFLGFGSEIQRKAGRWAGSSILDQKFDAGIGSPPTASLHRMRGGGRKSDWHFEIIDNLHEALVLLNTECHVGSSISGTDLRFNSNSQR